jgi:uncharacterized membrane protein
MIVLYISAGINYFLHPELYYPLIIPYLPYPIYINIASGFIEIVVGILLMFFPLEKQQQMV